MWVLPSPTTLWTSPWSKTYKDPERILPNKMHRHTYSPKCQSGRSEPLLFRRGELPVYKLVVLVLVFQTCLSSGEPIVPRIVRSSIIRPTRVTYGDIEKTNKTCAPLDTCAPSRSGKKTISSV